MNKNERYLNAIEREITNPSPAMQAYIAAARRHIAADEANFDAWSATADAQLERWGALTPAEQDTLRKINETV